MDVDTPPAAETPAAAPAADEEGRVAVGAVGAVGVPAAAPAPAPAPAAATLAALVVQVDEESAANSLFSELLLEVAQVVRLVEGVRDGNSDRFSDAEWIVATSLDGYFRKGMLPLEVGSSLREFLATLLNRPSTAISSKFQKEEMELGQQTFEPQDLDLAKAVRTFRDQVEAFVVSQQDRKYHGVSKYQRTNQWAARVTVPAVHRKVSDKEEMVNLGYFPTKKEAACAVDRLIKDDYRFNAKYVREKSNCIKYKEDFETMDDEMKAAAEVGRLAAEEAPGRLRHRQPAKPQARKPQARKPQAQKPQARKPQARKPQARKRARSLSRPTRADEAQRRAAQDPPRVLAPVPTTTPPVPDGTPAELAGAALARLGVKTVDPSANCAVARALLRVAQAARPDERLRKGKWPDEEFDLAEAFVAQFKARTLPLKRGSLLRTFLSEVLNSDGMRLTKKFSKSDVDLGKQVFVISEQNFDLDDVARRLEPLVEPFIQSLQALSRPSSPRPAAAPTQPPPLPPAGVPPPPANVARPVAAPAPAVAAPAPAAAMDVTE